MTTPTTIDTETELSAVNTILGAIGQSPVTTLGTVTTDVTSSSSEIANTFANPEIALIYQILKECNFDVQNEGWTFNREDHVPFQPDPTTKEIAIAANILRLDSENPEDKTIDPVKRGTKLYDKVNHTYEWNGSELYLNVVYLLPFNDLPSVFKRYITYKASGRAATQMVTNPQLVTLLGTQEQMARASCMEYECNQGDYNYLGMPHLSNYSTYKPYRALQR
jgi:hypothetical protein